MTETQKIDTEIQETPQVKNQPKLIISNYDISPKIVEAGRDFDLTFTLYNTNNKNTIYNLKITIDQQLQSQPQQKGENTALVSDGSVFTPVDSSNTFYVSALYPWNTTTESLEMRVNPNAVAGNYIIGVSLEYEDYNGNQYSTKESIGVSVVQRAHVTVGDVKIENLALGNPTQVSVNIYNTGKDNLNTFMAEVIGSGFSIDNDQKFIGNFNSGTTENFSFSITPDREGPVQGKILLTYEDSAGDVHTQTKDFASEVMSMGMGDENGMIEDPVTGEMIPIDGNMGEDPEANQSSGIFPFIIVLGLIIIGALSIVLIRKKRKEKKDQELIIEDED